MNSNSNSNTKDNGDTMRKVTNQAVHAFINFRAMSNGNTKVEINSNGDAVMMLHDNIIAMHYNDNGQIELSAAGWKSNTTKERLNGICQIVAGKSLINQKDFMWYYDGLPWNGDWQTIKK